MFALARAVAQHESALRSVAESQKQVEAAIDRLRSLLATGPISIETLQRAYNHRLWSEERLGRAIDEATRAEEAVEQARQVLQDHAKERKVMEQLRERHAARYRLQSERREQSQLDEVGARLARRGEGQQV